MAISLLNILYWKWQERVNTLIVSSAKWVIPTKGTGKSVFLLTVSFSSCSIGESTGEKDVRGDLILLRTSEFGQLTNCQSYIPIVPRFPYHSAFSPLSLFPHQLFIVV